MSENHDEKLSPTPGNVVGDSRVTDSKLTTDPQVPAITVKSFRSGIVIDPVKHHSRCQ